MEALRGTEKVGRDEVGVMVESEEAVVAERGLGGAEVTLTLTTAGIFLGINSTHPRSLTLASGLKYLGVAKQ